MSLRTNVRMYERYGLAELAEHHPINLAIDHLLSIETPAQRMLRINGPAIKRACEEMDAEMGRVPAAPGSHPADQTPAGFGAPRFDPSRMES